MKKRINKLATLMMSGILVFSQRGSLSVMAAPEDEDFGDLLQVKFDAEEEMEESQEFEKEPEAIEEDIECVEGERNIVKTGSYSGLKWTLDDEGLLIISGTGSGTVHDMYRGMSTYKDLRFCEEGTIRKVIIEEGVEGISKGVFSGCDKLKEISIPDSVTYIEANAFEGCLSLLSLTIPETVTYINEPYKYIRDIYYGGSEEEWNSIERIGDFSGATIHFAREAGDYQKIEIPVDDTIVDYGYCGKNVYWMLDKEGSLIIGGKGRMNDYSFYFDRFMSADIKRVVIKEGVTHIGAFAFSKGGYWDFEYKHYFMSSWLGYTMNDEPLKALKEVSIPSSVTSIGDGAFVYSTGLTDIYYNGTEDEWNRIKMGTSEDNVSAEVGMPSINPDPFEHATDLSDITFHFAQSTTISDSGFVDGPAPRLKYDNTGELRCYVKSIRDDSYTGLALYYSGGKDYFVYVKNGKRNETYSGYVEYNGGVFYVAGGTLADYLNGLVQDPNYPRDWYYLANGQKQSQYTGLAYYDGEWFYVTDGWLNTEYTAYTSYDGGLFYVGAGRIMKEINGLAKDPDGSDWYYLANGQAQTQYTGLAFYDGAWFYVVEGKLAEDYSGTVSYDGSEFNVVNGMVR